MKTLVLAASTVLLLAGAAEANGPGFPMGGGSGYVTPGVGYGGAGYGGGYGGLNGFGVPAGGIAPGYGGYGNPGYGNPGFGGYGNPGYGGYNYNSPYGGLNGQYRERGYGGLGNYNSFGGYYSNIQVNGIPNVLGGNYYGLNYGGNLNNYYRSASGYYYPWVGGTNYSSYPIFYSQSVSASPVAQLPPLSTMFQDLNDYLDQEKKADKLTDSDYEHLKQRASDLLSKEKSIAYQSGGLDTTQETDLRRDIEQLSAEVAQRVKR